MNIRQNPSESYEMLYKQKLNIRYSFNFSQTNKAFFINNPKVGSRYIIEATSNDTTTFEINLLDKNIHFKWTSTVDFDSNSSYLNEIYQDWDNIVNNTNKKDIVILYRDPLKRLVSAIIQDSLSLIETDKLSLYSKFESFGFSKNDIDLFDKWIHSVEHVNNLSIPMGNPTIHEMMWYLYKIHIDNILKKDDFHATHASPHNLPLVNLLNSINIDKNKIKFIDIDETPDELGNYLKSIELKVPTNKHSNNKMGKELVCDILLNHTDYRLHNNLYGEIVGYDILKTYHTS